MRRVSIWLARGILLAAVGFTGGRLDDPGPSPLFRSLEHIRAQDFSPLFAVARKRLEGHFTPEREKQFFETLFGVSGKWKAMTRGREAYERFVRRSFERTVLDPDELARVAEAIRQDWAFGLASAENRLLAILYEDLRPTHPRLTLPVLRARFDRLAADLVPCVVRDLGLNVASLVGSEAAAVILTSALTSTGLFGGAVAAGAAGGAWTFGIGLVVGLAVGFVIDGTAGEVYEDIGRQQIHLQVNDLRNRMINDVFDALARAVATYRKLQEDCVRAVYEGRTS
jgi:hypothetical protein